MNRLRRATRRDDGLGLVEVMISLVILAILLTAMLTLLVAALNAVAKNTTRASATELVTQRIEQARTTAVTGDCSNVKAVVQTPTTTVDGRGVTLTIQGTVANCVQVTADPHDEPRLARVTVTVTTTQAGYNNPVAKTTSDIYVRFEP